MNVSVRPARAKKKWLASFVALLALLLAGYLLRVQLERVVIAITIRNEHIFHPPRDVPAGEAARFYWDVAGLRVARQKRLKRFDPVLKPLVREIARRQAAHDPMQYSMHLYREVRWLLNFTDDTAATREKITALKMSLNDSADQRRATLQQPEDGSWALGITTWYLRLYYTVEDGLDNRKTTPPYRLDSATRVNARELISDLLKWCLARSYRPDGSFATSELDDTYGDAVFYGVSFLVDAGYFDREKRFWTNTDFPGAQAVRDRILEKLRQLNSPDPQLKDSYDLLVR